MNANDPSTPRAAHDVDLAAAQGIRGEARARTAHPRGRLLASIGASLIGLTLLGLALVYLVVPAYVQSRLQHALSDALGRAVSIESLRIDPLRLRVDIARLAIAEREAGGMPLLSIARLQADLAWASLRQRAPIISRLEIDAPALHVVRQQNGSLSIDDLLERWHRTVGSTGSAVPRFSLSNISLRDGTVLFDDIGVGQKHRIEDLKLSVPFISSLPVHGRIDVQPSLSALVNGARFTASGQAHPFGEQRRSTLSLDLGTSDLIRYRDYLRWALPVRIAAGQAAARLTLAFAQPEGQPASLRISGAVTLAGVDLREDDGPGRLELPAASVEIDAYDPRAGLLQVGRVVLSGPSVHLIRAAGRESLVDAIFAAPTAPAAGGEPGTPRPGLDWSLASFELVDGRAHYEARGGDGEAAVFDANRIHVAVTGLESTGTQTAAAEIELHGGNGESLSWQGQFGHHPLSASGRFEMRDIDLPGWAAWLPAGAPLRVVDGRLDMDGAFEASAAGANAQPMRLLAWRTKARDIRLAPAAHDTTAPAAQSVAALSIDGLSIDWESHRIAFTTLAADSADLRLRRRDDGRIDLLAILEPFSGEQPASWHLEPGAITLGDTRIGFEDRVGDQTVSHQLHARALRIDPNQDAQHMAPVMFELRYGDAGADSTSARLAGHGRIGFSPFRLRTTLELAQFPLARWQMYRGLPAGLRFTGALADGRGELSLAAASEAQPPMLDWRGSLSVSKLALLRGPETMPLLSIARLDLDRLAVQDSPLRVETGELRLQSPSLRIVLDAQGTPVAGDSGQSAPMRSPEAADSSQASPGPKPDPATRFSLDAIRIHDGELTLVDRSLGEEHVSRALELNGVLAPVANIGLSELALKGRVESGGSFDLLGKVSPLDPLAALDIDAHAGDISLPALGVYVERVLGHRIESGSSDMELKIRLAERTLSANARFSLTGLVLGAPLSGTGVDAHADKAPVGFAMALLRERDDRVRIELPLEASLDDPGFSFTGALARGFRDRIAAVAAAPFASLGGGGDPKLEASRQLEFEPGSDKLDKAATARLRLLASRIAARPALALRITGLADAAGDRQALAERQFERLLKARKLRGQRGNPDASLDSVTIGRGEYPVLVETLFREAQLPLPSGPNGRPREMSITEKARSLAATLPVGDSQLRELAAARADAARRWFARDGGIEARRLMLAQPRLEPGAARAGVELMLEPTP